MSTKKTNIGGQALIEGLLMLGPDKAARANRFPDGSIRLTYMQRPKPLPVMKIPVIRGVVGLFTQLKLGMKAMNDAADEQEAAESGLAAPDQQTPEAREKSGQESSNRAAVFSMLLGVLLAVFLFIFVPNAVVSLLYKGAAASWRESFKGSLTVNLTEGLIRIIILLLYMYLTSLIPDIKRVWQYHGAEHKTIACYEAGEPLDPGHIQNFSRFHPRCGTSFLLIAVLIGAIVYAFTGWYVMWLNLLLRLLLIPVIAGLSYELLRFSGRHDREWYGKALAQPGLWLQRLTTREPDPAMLEVAAVALKAVLPAHEGEDDWDQN
ncbi:MAG: DUF1385 domain-containing protein [Oscillospiraceae bacterium]|nr:DUF1385 domain-containing protein [Oscillospiraceae bacterium]MDD4369157.1 DUF1385 domain-containing protein [Oscillospiraceae bacterium]